jgi:hypothetical protein
MGRAGLALDPLREIPQHREPDNEGQHRHDCHNHEMTIRRDGSFMAISPTNQR